MGLQELIRLSALSTIWDESCDTKEVGCISEAPNILLDHI